MNAPSTPERRAILRLVRLTEIPWPAEKPVTIRRIASEADLATIKAFLDPICFDGEQLSDVIDWLIPAIDERALPDELLERLANLKDALIGASHAAHDLELRAREIEDKNDEGAEQDRADDEDTLTFPEDL